MKAPRWLVLTGKALVAVSFFGSLFVLWWLS